jgi:hypothetical protein
MVKCHITRGVHPRSVEKFSSTHLSAEYSHGSLIIAAASFPKLLTISWETTVWESGPPSEAPPGQVFGLFEQELGLKSKQKQVVL